MSNADKDAKAIRSRSTSTEAQRARLLALLRTGPQTTYGLRKHGVAVTSARIFDLRAEGFEIATERVTAYDSDGYAHIGVARYTLLREPPQQNELPGVANG